MSSKIELVEKASKPSANVSALCRCAPSRGLANMTLGDYYMTMKKVGIAELKAHLSQHLRTVRRGHSITVMDRDTPVAKLTPYEEADAPLVVRHRAGNLHSVELPPPLAKSVDSLALLLEERRFER